MGKKSLASAIQRARVHPFLVFEESAQRQCDLPMLVAFGPSWKGLGITQYVTPKYREIVDPVKRFRLWNAIERWHDFHLGLKRECYRTVSHRWLPMAGLAGR
jgi:hypothetical protein